MAEQSAALTNQIETPSGKGAGDENFPVASMLVARALRPHVLVFYAFARAADDIADNSELDRDEKLRRLDAMEEGLSGNGPSKAVALQKSLHVCGVTDRHARDLLSAFRQDAWKNRYADWDELIGYCSLSANPVGRYLMDLHREDRALWVAADALCTALQILNHLQDCGEDYVKMDRVYLPLDLMFAIGTGVDALAQPALDPALRSVLDEVLDRCDVLIEAARERSVCPVSLRLHAEMAMITALAARLARRLRREDPLAGRVELSRLDFAMAALAGVRALVTWRRG